MSGENVEIVLRAYEALNNREFSRIDEFLDPEAEIDHLAERANSGIHRGLRGSNQFRLRDRRIVQIVGGFRSKADALEAAGLSEQA
jgi:hypothetical protein